MTPSIHHFEWKLTVNRNDYFVSGFDGSELHLVEVGRGGMAQVKKVLSEQFESGTAIAMFRITAVDDRENTVSYRTKLVHVIFTGPRTPVMKRAKIASHNAAFKQPFSFNLSIQTDDAESDLTEEALERSLRASGGAHQPTRYDFTNNLEGVKQVRRSDVKSPSANSSFMSSATSPRAAVPESLSEPAIASYATPSKAEPEETYRSVSEVVDDQLESLGRKDVNKLMEDFSDDSQLHHTESMDMKTTSYYGVEEIRGFFTEMLTKVSENELEIKVNNTVGEICKLEWDCLDSGFLYATDVFHVLKGKIAVRSIVTVMQNEDEDEDDDELVGNGEAVAGTVLVATDDEAGEEAYDGEEEAVNEEMARGGYRN